MPIDFTPRPYQGIAGNFLMEKLSDEGRAALWAPPGMGKTIISYTTLSDLAFCGYDVYPALVLGPLRVARDVWTDEAHKWNHLKDLKVITICGTKEERIAALAQKADIYTINYEQLPWLTHQLPKTIWPFKTIIADEATRLKNYRTKQGGIRAQCLSQVAWERVKYWINLTGTPAPNGLRDLWGQTWFLDRGKRLGLTYSAFEERWFYRPPRSSAEEYAQPIKAFRHSSDEIHKLVGDLCMSLDPKDWFDIEEPMIIPIKVKLPLAARKLYDKFEATMFAELQDAKELEAVNAAALTMKCMQIANGAVYYDKEGSYQHVHDAKIEALESIVAESGGMPILVAYNFTSDKERIQKAFPKAVLLSEKKGMAAFKAGNAPMGIAHAKSVGHGVDGLQLVTNIMVRFGHGWEMEERLQMVERIGPVRQRQAGFSRPTLVYDIIAEDTIDETVIARHVTKRGVQDLLLAAVKAGGCGEVITQQTEIWE